MGRLKVEDIRHYILDRSAADNDLDGDLSFSDEEIANAMKAAARDYNSIPPYSQTAQANCLPDDTNIFIDGTLKHLYITAVSRAKRNELEYNAGGVTTSNNAAFIKHMTDLIKLHGDMFREAVTNKKLFLNIRRAFRHY
jgi:hypothetical protein